ncbi:MAG: alpha/beta family hydrolase [Pseudomonadota bacterium]
MRTHALSGVEPIAELLLAHGAGAPMDSPFMDAFVVAAAELGIASTRFEFDYMAARRIGGKRRPPPRADKLTPAFEATVQQWANQLTSSDVPRLVGGKSMGGRIATMIEQNELAERGVVGRVCLGYPFHPQGRPDALRTEHLLKMTSPVLILQGERDPFGKRGELATYGLPSNIQVVWMDDGDHDFGPRGRSSATRKDNIRAAASAVAAFAQSLS